jgi:hypothetical protein
MAIPCKRSDPFAIRGFWMQKVRRGKQSKSVRIFGMSVPLGMCYELQQS